MENVEFVYKNYRGETRFRNVKPERLTWLPKPGFGYQPGWFLEGICNDSGERRSFALVNIILPSANSIYKLLELK